MEYLQKNKMGEKVQNVHRKILNEFKAFELIDDLFSKINTLLLPSTLKDTIALQ